MIITLLVVLPMREAGEIPPLFAYYAGLIKGKIARKIARKCLQTRNSGLQIRKEENAENIGNTRKIEDLCRS